MARVLNRKMARVGLPTHSNKIAYFDPGEHEYPDAMLDDLNNSRSSVRAYFDGDPPVLEVLEASKPELPAEIVAEETAPKMKASEMVARVKGSTDLKWLGELAKTDGRKTVEAAVEARLGDLEVVS